jgi:hypothetical protein
LLACKLRTWKRLKTEHHIRNAFFLQHSAQWTQRTWVKRNATETSETARFKKAREFPSSKRFAIGKLYQLNSLIVVGVRFKGS